MPTPPPFRLGCGSLVLLAVTLSGCGGESHDRYIPPGEKARGAVEAVLSAWKAGEPPKTVSSQGIAVDLYDARRRDGRKLADFKILEEVAGGEHPSFRVSLKFADKPQEEETTYLVIGIDPLNVFRAEDYTRATGM